VDKWRAARASTRFQIVHQVVSNCITSLLVGSPSVGWVSRLKDRRVDSRRDPDLDSLRDRESLMQAHYRQNEPSPIRPRASAWARSFGLASDRRVRLLVDRGDVARLASGWRIWDATIRPPLSLRAHTPRLAAFEDAEAKLQTLHRPVEAGKKSGPTVHGPRERPAHRLSAV